jgi:hypothetical protein
MILWLIVLASPVLAVVGSGLLLWWDLKTTPDEVHEQCAAIDLDLRRKGL